MIPKQSFCIVTRLADDVCADDCPGKDTAEMIFNNLFVRSLGQIPSHVSHCDAREVNGLGHRHHVVQVS